MRKEKFVSGLPMTDREVDRDKPTLNKAFERGDAATARKRRRKGFHQSYLLRATPETKRITNRMVGSE